MYIFVIILESLVATVWTEVDMFTRLWPDGVPGIGADRSNFS